jgi:hypothetical protein
MVSARSWPSWKRKRSSSPRGVATFITKSTSDTRQRTRGHVSRRSQPSGSGCTAASTSCANCSARRRRASSPRCVLAPAGVDHGGNAVPLRLECPNWRESAAVRAPADTQGGKASSPPVWAYPSWGGPAASPLLRGSPRHCPVALVNTQVARKFYSDMTRPPLPSSARRIRQGSPSRGRSGRSAGLFAFDGVRKKGDR